MPLITLPAVEQQSIVSSMSVCVGVVHSSPVSAARMLILCGILVVVAVLSGNYGSDVDTVGWASGRASGL